MISSGSVHTKRMISQIQHLKRQLPRALPSSRSAGTMKYRESDEVWRISVSAISTRVSIGGAFGPRNRFYCVGLRRRFFDSVAPRTYPIADSRNDVSTSMVRQLSTLIHPGDNTSGNYNGMTNNAVKTNSKNIKKERSVLDIETLRAPLFDPTSSTIPDVGPRPQTAMERMKNFPKGVFALFKDCLRYKHIHDASKTPRNSWTIRADKTTDESHLISGKSGQESKQPSFFIYENEIRPGRIPRRQYEQQRQLKADFRTMIPLVALWIPPIIGFLPPILAMLAPRQVMSRHFHNNYEILWYNAIEYSQRKQSFVPLGDLFWSSFPHINIRKVVQMEGTDAYPSDKAGPILDARLLYAAFCPHEGSSHDPYHGVVPSSKATAALLAGMRHGIYTSVYDLPREYLVKLSLSVGICQQVPGWLSKALVQVSPSMWLRRQLNRISEVVCHDDALLLEEGHHCNHCASLTDEEVTDACLIRGLPVEMDDPIEVRRECLTNHLNMIAQVKRSMDGPMDQSFQVFTMHLAPLRYHLKTLQMTVVESASKKSVQT